MIKIPNKTRIADPGAMGIKASLGASSAEANAFGDLGQALGVAGDTLTSITTKINRAYTTQQVSEVELTAGARTAQFYADIDGRQDPTNWLGEFGSVVDGVRADAAGRKISKEGRRLLNSRLDAWEIQAKGKLGLEVASMVTRQTKDVLYQKHSAAGSMGDQAAQERIRQEMLDSGVFHASEVKELGVNAEREYEIDQYLKRAEAAPEEFKDELPDLPVDPPTRRRIEGAVDRSILKKQNDFAAELDVKIQQGEAYTHDEITQYLEAKLITPKEGARMLNNVDIPYSRKSWEEYINLKREIYSLNPNDPSAAAMATVKIAGAEISQDDKRAMGSLLKRVAGAPTDQGNRETSSLMTSAVSFMKSIASANKSNKGAFGAEKTFQVDQATGADVWVDNKKSLAESYRAMAKITDDLESWLTTHPDGMKADRVATANWLNNRLLSAGYEAPVIDALDRLNGRGSMIDPTLFGEESIQQLLKKARAPVRAATPPLKLDPKQQGLPLPKAP